MLDISEEKRISMGNMVRIIRRICKVERMVKNRNIKVKL